MGDGDSERIDYYEAGLNDYIIFADDLSPPDGGKLIAKVIAGGLLGALLEKSELSADEKLKLKRSADNYLIEMDNALASFMDAIGRRAIRSFLKASLDACDFDASEREIWEGELDILSLRRKLEKAEPGISRAFEFHRAAYGDHPITAIDLRNLGLLHLGLGNLAASRREIVLAANVVERIYGPSHLATAAIRNDLGCVYQAMGSAIEAKVNFRRAIEIFKGAEEAGRHHLAVISNNLGNAQIEMGRLDESIESFKVAEGIFEQGKEHYYSDKVRRKLRILKRRAKT